VINDHLAIPVIVPIAMLLDNHGLVAGFVFPNDRGAIMVVVTIPVAVSGPDSYADRANLALLNTAKSTSRRSNRSCNISP
jgi:hypothetical protein